MLNEEPPKLKKDTLAAWKAAGPINLLDILDKSNLSIEPQLKIVFNDAIASNGDPYWGQPIEVTQLGCPVGCGQLKLTHLG